MRRPASLVTILLALTAAAFTAQQTPAARTSASKPTSAQTKFLAAGPFLFEPGAIRPTFLDAFQDRPTVVSPDGSLEVTVTGPARSLLAWVTVVPRGYPAPGIPFRVWPLEASGDVLWRPDSQTFALTDNRYANLSYVFVCGTAFSLGENGAQPGVPIIDLTPLVKRAFDKRAKRYYAGSFDEDRLFYAKALRWLGGDKLLVGVSALTSGPPNLPNRGLKDWDVAYVVDVPHKTVLGEVSESALLSQYGIKVSDK